MKLKHLLPIAGLLAFTVNAQEPEHFCSTDEETQKLREQNPELKAAYDNLHQEILEIVNSPFQQKSDQVYTIPVVFHVLHEYGVENISDEQIYRAIEIVNEDFRKLNADTIDIVSNFVDRAADTKIEFKLATVDPFGNPTNGIVRHFTHETNIGDAFSKLTQWPRGRYLNIWVNKSMESPGAAGYSHFPVNVEGNNRFMDGIMILHGYIGDIGTGNAYRSRALTHEIGHYLGLPHTWGGTNTPGLPVNCGDDDGIDDTPNTIGSNTCDLTLSTCNQIMPDNLADTLDNVQNFMDYSYCSNMYTEGQAAYMRNILNLNVSQRDNLWSEANLLASVPDGQVYTPIADFFTNNNSLSACVGENVNFKNWTWRLSGNNNETYTWTFEDGSVETSTDVNPTVSFNSPGWKTVSLTVEEDGLTHTVTKENFIWISPTWPIHQGLVEFNFDDNPDYWVIQNPQNYPFQWAVRSDAGVNGSGAMFLDMSNPYEDPVAFTDEFFFEQRRGKSKSAFVSQPIDVTYLTDAVLSFDWACATDGSTSDEITEELNIYTSVNCGLTWILRKKISGADLVNNGSGWDSFYPNQTSVWSTETATLPNSLTGNILIKFEYTGSDKSNNIAIDNIRIDGTVGIDAHGMAENLKVHPNPSNNETGWNIKYDAAIWGGALAQLVDVSGRVITTTVLPENLTETNIKPTTNASNGIYFLKISTTDKTVQKKLVLN